MVKHSVITCNVITDLLAVLLEVEVTNFLLPFLSFLGSIKSKAILLQARDLIVRFNPFNAVLIVLKPVRMK